MIFLYQCKLSIPKTLLFSMKIVNYFTQTFPAFLLTLVTLFTFFCNCLISNIIFFFIVFSIISIFSLFILCVSVSLKNVKKLIKDEKTFSDILRLKNVRKIIESEKTCSEIPPYPILFNFKEQFIAQVANAGLNALSRTIASLTTGEISGLATAAVITTIGEEVVINSVNNSTALNEEQAFNREGDRYLKNGMPFCADHSYNQAGWTQRINAARPPGGVISSSLNEVLRTEEYCTIRRNREESLEWTKRQAIEERDQMEQDRREKREQLKDDERWNRMGNFSRACHGLNRAASLVSEIPGSKPLLDMAGRVIEHKITNALRSVVYDGTVAGFQQGATIYKFVPSQNGENSFILVEDHSDYSKFEPNTSESNEEFGILRNSDKNSGKPSNFPVKTEPTEIEGQQLEQEQRPLLQKAIALKPEDIQNLEDLLKEMEKITKK